MSNGIATETKTSVKTKVIVGLAAAAIVGMAAAGTYLDQLKADRGEAKLTITNPSSGAVLDWNTRQWITWEAKGKTGMVSVELLRSDNNTKPFRKIKEVKMESERMSWVPSSSLPNFEEDVTGEGETPFSFKIVIKSLEGKTWGVAGPFTLKKTDVGSITLNVPNGGETYKLAKSTVPVAWEATAEVVKVKLVLLMNGRRKATIAGDAGVSGAFNWKISKTLEANQFDSSKDKFKIRAIGYVVGSDGETIEGPIDDSNKAFEISGGVGAPTNSTPGSPTTSPNPNVGLEFTSCGRYNDDKGNYGVSGTSAGQFKIGGVASPDAITMTDRCLSINKLEEWYCDGKDLKVVTPDCSSVCNATEGAYCDNGACYKDYVACSGQATGGTDIFTGSKPTYTSCVLRGKFQYADARFKIEGLSSEFRTYLESYCDGDSLMKTKCGSNNVPGYDKVTCELGCTDYDGGAGCASGTPPPVDY